MIAEIISTIFKCLIEVILELWIEARSKRKPPPPP